MKALTIGVLLGAFLSFAASRRRRVAAIARDTTAYAETARRAHTGSAEASARPQNLEDLTKDELYQRAQQEDIAGRSTMSKEELIKALREAHGR